MLIQELLEMLEAATTDTARDKDPKYVRVFAEITVYDEDDEDVILHNDSLEVALQELRPLRGKKFRTDWDWMSGTPSLSVFNFSGAEKIFSGPNAIDKFLDEFGDAEEVKGFKSTIRKPHRED